MLCTSLYVFDFVCRMSKKVSSYAHVSEKMRGNLEFINSKSTQSWLPNTDRFIDTSIDLSILFKSETCGCVTRKTQSWIASWYCHFSSFESRYGYYTQPNSTDTGTSMCPHAHAVLPRRPRKIVSTSANLSRRV